MTVDQIAILAVLVTVVVLFVWGRLRVDVVALLALLSCVGLGLIPNEVAFSGFGHPAVITVAAVLGLSAALSRSGLIDLIASRLAKLSATRLGQTAALCGLGGALSGFMNNVGALAMLMPVALSMAKRGQYRSGLVLMPLAFATILGGMPTLNGTPPQPSGLGLSAPGDRRGLRAVRFRLGRGAAGAGGRGLPGAGRLAPAAGARWRRRVGIAAL